MAKPRIRVSGDVRVQRKQSVLTRVLWFLLTIVLFFVSLGFLADENFIAAGFFGGCGIGTLLNAFSRYRDLN